MIDVTPERIGRLYNKYKGEQALIVCTGPSLKMIDPRIITEHPHSIVINGARLVRPKPRFYCAWQNYFMRYQDEIVKEVDPSEGFVFNRNALSYRDPGRETVMSHSYEDEERFYRRLPSNKLILYDRNPDKHTEPHANMGKTLAIGPTTLFDSALPLAIWCGYRQMILVGADYTRDRKDAVYQQFYSEDSRSQEADRSTRCLTEMERARHRAYQWAAYIERQHPGLEVINCSPGSDLDAFPIRDVSEFIKF